jgi:hypothetical protein
MSATRTHPHGHNSAWSDSSSCCLSMARGWGHSGSAVRHSPPPPLLGWVMPHQQATHPKPCQGGCVLLVGGGGGAGGVNPLLRKVQCAAGSIGKCDVPLTCQRAAPSRVAAATSSLGWRPVAGGCWCYEWCLSLMQDHMLGITPVGVTLLLLPIRLEFVQEHTAWPAAAAAAAAVEAYGRPDPAISYTLQGCTIQFFSKIQCLCLHAAHT